MEEEASKKSFDVLKEKTKEVTELLGEVGLDLEHLQAILHDAFKNGAIQESIYAEHDFVAHESLARPKDKYGRVYSIGRIARAFYERGMAVEFDTLTTKIGFEYAKDFPATFNISIESALSPKFWENIQEEAEEIGQENLIFEILEHDISPDTDISVFLERKSRGYRFALDDFSLGKPHENRLAVFGEHVDYIKIDGPLVRAFLEGEFHEEHDDGTSIHYTKEDFESAISTIEKFYQDKGLPVPQLIAERVYNAEEARILFGMGFTGVQGRELKPEYFYYTPEMQQPLVTPHHPWDHLA